MIDEVLTEVTENEVMEAAEAEAHTEKMAGDQTEQKEENVETELDSSLTEDETSKEKEPSVEEMLKELKALREELLEKRKAFEKMSRDISEFEELFPEKNVNEIPDSVWESVKTGIPLAAAYALYERKNAIRRDTAESTNVENRSRTTGSIGRDTTDSFYTPDEVKAMSRAEVKSNYSKILESMKKWN